MDSVMPKLDALKGDWGQQNRARQVVQQPVAQQPAQRRWNAPSYSCEMLKEAENPSSFKIWREQVEIWFDCGGMNFHQKKSSMDF